jgi:prepilin-type N-terminal cleavage/methylation domain-containing protein
MKNLIKTKAKKGFSLVELLVVIAVIGVIAAIAIPAMSGIFGQSEATRTQRNAQSIVSTFNSARAAGNQATYANEAAVTAAICGVAPINGGGAFAASTFHCPMGADEITAAVALIDDAALIAAPTTGILALTP